MIFILWVIFTIIAVLISLMIAAAFLSKHPFKCPNCGLETKFKWYKLIFITHSYNEYGIKCPKCKNKTMIEK